MCLCRKLTAGNDRCVISSKHGGCVVVPRENGYTRYEFDSHPMSFDLQSCRIYTQLDISATGPISVSRQVADPSFAESGGQIDVHSITPGEVLEQANRIFAPYKLKFAAPLSWFAIWRSIRAEPVC